MKVFPESSATPIRNSPPSPQTPRFRSLILPRLRKERMRGRPTIIIEWAIKERGAKRKKTMPARYVGTTLR